MKSTLHIHFCGSKMFRLNRPVFLKTVREKLRKVLGCSQNSASVSRSEWFRKIKVILKHNGHVILEVNR